MNFRKQRELIAVKEEEAEAEQILHLSLAALPQKLCEVLNRHFGLNDHELQTLKAIGHALGYNSERVR